MALQNTAACRTNFLFRALFNLVPLVAALAMWRAIFAGGRQSVAGYSLAQMVSYYLIITVIEIMTAVTEDEWQVANDIKDGRITQFLLRPVGYFGYRITSFCANRVVYAAIALLPLAVIIVWNYDRVLLPANSGALAAFALSVCFSAILQFLLAYLTALLAFWVLEISTLSFMLLAAQRIASGEMFPLDLLPSWLGHLLMLTPFPYCMYFPASVYMGRTQCGMLAQGLAMQLAWIAVLYLGTRFVWRRGLLTFTAVGG